MRTRFFVAALLCSTAALAAPERIGLYPLALPHGQEQLGERLSAQLHDGAAALPGVRAFDLVAHSSCAPDEAVCLSDAARRASLEAMISAAIEATAQGYLWRLREFGEGGKLLQQARGQTRGGPLDLASDLERGVCELLGAAPCEGTLSVAGAAEAHLFVDGADRGAAPLSAPLRVGRHTVKLGADERRIRVSYARTTRLFATLRAGHPALLESPPQEEPQPAPALAVSAAPPATVIESRSRAARVLFGSGMALLAGAAGVALYATYAPSQTSADLARVLAITGAGAVASAGLVVALTPSGAVVAGSF